jgi:hypothetical protein
MICVLFKVLFIFKREKFKTGGNYLSGTPLRNRPDIGNLQRVRQFQVGSELGNVPESEHETGKIKF